MYWGGAQYPGYGPQQQQVSAQPTVGPGYGYGGNRAWQHQQLTEEQNLQALQQQSMLYSQQQQMHQYQQQPHQPQQPQQMVQQAAVNPNTTAPVAGTVQDFDEKTFDAQFSDWEKQYESWKEQNKNHPDKDAFNQYDQQWQSWKAQLLERRALFMSMKGNTAGAGTPAVGSAPASTPVVTGQAPVPVTANQPENTAVPSQLVTSAAASQQASAQNNGAQPTGLGPDGAKSEANNSQQHYQMNQYSNMYGHGYQCSPQDMYGVNQQANMPGNEQNMMGGQAQMSGNSQDVTDSESRGMMSSQGIRMLGNQQGMQGNRPGMPGNQQAMNSQANMTGNESQRMMSNQGTRTPGNQQGNNPRIPGNQQTMSNESQGTRMLGNQPGSRSRMPGNQEGMMGNRQRMLGNQQGMMGNRSRMPGNQQGMMGNRPRMPGNQQGMMGNRPRMPGNQQGMMGYHARMPGNNQQMMKKDPESEDDDKQQEMGDDKQGMPESGFGNPRMSGNQRMMQGNQPMSGGPRMPGPQQMMQGKQMMGRSMNQRMMQRNRNNANMEGNFMNDGGNNWPEDEAESAYDDQGYDEENYPMEEENFDGGPRMQNQGFQPRGNFNNMQRQQRWSNPRMLQGGLPGRMRNPNMGPGGFNMPQGRNFDNFNNQGKIRPLMSPEDMKMIRNRAANQQRCPSNETNVEDESESMPNEEFSEQDASGPSNTSAVEGPAAKPQELLKAPDSTNPSQNVGIAEKLAKLASGSADYDGNMPMANQPDQEPLDYPSDYMDERAYHPAQRGRGRGGRGRMLPRGGMQRMPIRQQYNEMYDDDYQDDYPDNRGRQFGQRGMFPVEMEEYPLDDPRFQEYEEWWYMNRVWDDPFYDAWMYQHYPNFRPDPYRDPLPPMRGFYHFLKVRSRKRAMQQQRRDMRMRDPVVSIDYGHRSTQGSSEDVQPVDPSPGPLPITEPVSSILSKLETFEYGHGGSNERDSNRKETPTRKVEPDSSSDRDRLSPSDRKYHSGRHSSFDRDRSSKESGMERSRDREQREKHRSESHSRSRESDTRPRERLDEPSVKKKAETVLVEDLLCQPGRQKRPRRILIILRGLPGSGKTFVAKLIKNKEVENGGAAPRMLCLDDYFMQEKETMQTDPDTNRKVKVKKMVYEFEAEMEPAYRTSLMKSLQKNIESGLHPFIIIDAPNEKTKYYAEYYQHATEKGYEVYIGEMENTDPMACFKKNIHGRTLQQIAQVVKYFQPTPATYNKIDIRSLLQDASIPEVEMEDHVSDEKQDEETIEQPTIEDDKEQYSENTSSKWETMEASDSRLDKLDGLRKKRAPQRMEDYLQLPDDYDQRDSQPGKRRVRWRDLEERKNQERARAIGFVIGQTDWNKMTDPNHADQALTSTKYI